LVNSEPAQQKKYFLLTFFVKDVKSCDNTMAWLYIYIQALLAGSGVPGQEQARVSGSGQCEAMVVLKRAAEELSLVATTCGGVVAIVTLLSFPSFRRAFEHMPKHMV
jgi:hypothetical protein